MDEEPKNQVMRWERWPEEGEERDRSAKERLTEKVRKGELTSMTTDWFKGRREGKSELAKEREDASSLRRTHEGRRLQRDEETESTGVSMILS